jgi:hypothetical protein
MTIPRPDPLPPLRTLAAALAAPDQPGASFAALDAALAAAIGHRLFTVLVIHDGAKESQRYYSNQPAAYPVGGRKPITDHPWMRRVVQGGEPWIGNSYQDVAWAFYDHELIRSLGCESALNIPVRWAGRTLGTLNLLHEAGWYRPEDAETGRLFAALAAPALLHVIAGG